MAEWFLVVLTTLTLLVFIRYAYDTYRIAKSSVAQTENSHMPFLAVAQQENIQGRQGGWILQNQGFGPALNAIYPLYDANGRKYSHRFIAPLSQGAEYSAVHNDIAEALNSGRDFEIVYESLSGHSYRTVVTLKPGMPLQTKFIRPEKLAGARFLSAGVKFRVPWYIE